jgi:hypothetical protein
VGYGKYLIWSLKVTPPDESEIRKPAPPLIETDQLADQVVQKLLLKNGFGQTMSWIKEG